MTDIETALVVVGRPWPAIPIENDKTRSHQSTQVGFASLRSTSNLHSTLPHYTFSRIIILPVVNLTTELLPFNHLSY